MNLGHLGASEQARRFASLSADLALASDRWFLGALDRADSGARWLKSAATRLGEAPARLWERLLPPRSPRERMLALLRAEARRARYDISQPAFQLFSERIAVLLDLVFTGAVGLDDIAFEAAPSAEVSEEMADHADNDQADEEQALGVEQEGSPTGTIGGGEIA
jgi:hypothetical protein